MKQPDTWERILRIAKFQTVARDMPREQALAYGDELVAFFSAGMKAQVEFN